METVKPQHTSSQGLIRPLRSSPAAGPGTEPPSIWKSRAFLLVFTGYNLSLFGNTFHSLALNLWVLQTTGSAKMMSLVLITHMAITMLFGSIAGTIADRVNRRTLMWAADLIRFALVALLALLMAVPGSPFVLILLLTALTAFAGVLRTPAFQAALAEIVGKERIAQAVGAMTISDNMVRIGGYAAGGIATAAFGGAVAVAVDALMFLLSALLVLAAGAFPFAKERVATEKRQQSSFREDFMAGLRFAGSDRLTRTIIGLLPFVLFFFLSSFMLIQVMAVQVWKVTPFTLGLIEACIPLGYILGSILIMTFERRIGRSGKWVLASVVLLGPAFIWISQASSAMLALPFIMFAGFLFSFSTTILHILLRTAVEPDMLGRVFGLLGSLTSAAPPLGLALFAALSDQYGPSIVIACSGAVLLAGSLAVSRTIWRIGEREQVASRGNRD